MLGDAPCSQSLDDARGIRPAAAEESREHAAAPCRDHLAADQHVELSGTADFERWDDAQLLLDLGGETRRPVAIASGLAVADLHVHLGDLHAGNASFMAHATHERKSSEHGEIGEPAFGLRTWRRRR